MDEREFLHSLFAAAVDAALPHRVIAEHIPTPPTGRLVVVGAGKASAAMAATFEAQYDGRLEGLVVTRYGHTVPCKRIEIAEASHPVPDAAGCDAAARILSLANELEEGDLMVALISGGGSSLLSLPTDGVSLEDKQEVNRQLLACGAAIEEMNCVRKHLSTIKGGRLAAAAYPARVLTLVISDVPGDDPSDIASGPTVGDITTLQEARDIVARYGLEVPASVQAALSTAENESPFPDDPRFIGHEVRVIAAPQASLLAAAEVSVSQGIPPVLLGDALEGDARGMGQMMAGIAQAVQNHGTPHPAPCVLISGGETTVTLRGTPNGVGGRNVEFLMGFASALQGADGIYAIAGDTDGVDGAAEVAGGIVTPDTISRAYEAGYPLSDAMIRHDGHGFFEAVGDQVITGPTLTNVNDFRAILILPKA